jgi:hypothetical protein
MKAKKQSKSLLGLGLDSKDDHKRITKGENFLLVGGSKETHAQMQEKAIKVNEQLKKQKKTLDTVSAKEFLDIAHKVGLKEMDVEQFRRPQVNPSNN